MVSFFNIMYNKDNFPLKEGFLVKKFLIMTLLLLSLFTLGGCTIIDYLTEPDEIQLRLMDARAVGREATLGIKVEKSDRTFANTSESTAFGSGFVFSQSDTDYYILTNHHVIDPEDFSEVIYTVFNLETEDVAATLLYINPDKDLALLSVSKDDITLGILDIDQRKDTRFTSRELLLSVGYPSDIRGLVTYGEYLGMGTTDKVDFEVIAHSALIYPGNSGGPLLDLDGNVVGINTWSSSNNQERFMAIPLGVIHDFIAAWEATYDSSADAR